jgi:hypothetical protein
MTGSQPSNSPGYTKPKPATAMKATKLLIAAATFVGLASLSFAGPGPDYWARMNAAGKKASTPSIGQNKATAETMAKVKPAADAPATCANCVCCAKQA